MFEAILNETDARRATSVAETLLTHGLRAALTGGVAVEAQLRAHGRSFRQRSLNDLDLVVEDFEAIPSALAEDFWVSHVHPLAPQGKLLLQLVDRINAVRVDLFRAFGDTLLRAHSLDGDTSPLVSVAVEDLVARTTAHVCAALGRGRQVDGKHVTTLRRLMGLGDAKALDRAWHDHRLDLLMPFQDARREAVRLATLRTDLIVAEAHSSIETVCERCRPEGRFRPVASDVIVRLLGYR